VEHSRSKKIRVVDLENQPTINPFDNLELIKTLKECSLFSLSGDKINAKWDQTWQCENPEETEFYKEYLEANDKNLPFSKCFFNFETDSENICNSGILLIDTISSIFRDSIMIHDATKKGIISGMVATLDISSNDGHILYKPGMFFIYYIELKTLVVGSAKEFHSLDENMATPFKEGIDILLKWVNSAISIMYRPREFIFEEGPAELRIRKGKKIKRSHQRPKYTILNPYEIKTVFRLHNETGRKLITHARRRYEKTYRHPRYVKMQGQKQWVEAYWVGTSEKVIGNKKYKVRLDL